MEITGKIIQILPEENSATDATKPWKKVGAVLETIETYPKRYILNCSMNELNRIR